jgi:PTH2 family peptidyl-tRNA hydrolase
MTYKQIIVIRTDTKMHKGKMVGQGCHASLIAFVKSIFSRKLLRALKWWRHPQTKVVCRVDSEDELELVARAAEQAGLIVYRVHDAGFTQLEPNTFTCIGIGPDREDVLRPITGSLRLL